MRNPFLGALLAFSLLGSASGTAQAALIDFTDATIWSAAAGNTTFTATQNGVQVRLTSTGGNLTFNTFDGGGGDPNPCATLACNGDGIGVGDDEVSFAISFGESLKVEFLNTALDLASFDFLDLFGVNSGTGDPSAEVAQWLIDGGAGGSATGIRPDPDTTGWLNVAVTDSGVTSITFFADGGATQGIESPDNTDFAVAAIDGTPVPEPGALALVGAGLAGLGLAARRRKSRV